MEQTFSHLIPKIPLKIKLLDCQHWLTLAFSKAGYPPGRIFRSNNIFYLVLFSIVICQVDPVSRLLTLEKKSAEAKSKKTRSIKESIEQGFAHLEPLQSVCNESVQLTLFIGHGDVALICPTASSLIALPLNFRSNSPSSTDKTIVCVDRLVIFWMIKY